MRRRAIVVQGGEDAIGERRRLTWGVRSGAYLKMSGRGAGISGVLGCGERQKDGRRCGGGAMLDGELETGRDLACSCP